MIIRGPKGHFFIRKVLRKLATLAPLFSVSLLLGILYIQESSAQDTAAISGSFSSPPSSLSQVKSSTEQNDSPKSEAITVEEPVAQAQNPQPQLTAKSRWCNTAAFNKPAGVATSGVSAGVHIFINQPTYYNFGSGSSASDTINRAKDCARQQALLAGFDAVTNYKISWSFGVNGDASSCGLSDVRITQQINQLLPSTDISSGQQSVWDSSLAKLVSHEQQHLSYDVSYAHTLNSRLLAIRESDCTKAQNLAKTTVANTLAELDSMHRQLDQGSNHGTN